MLVNVFEKGIVDVHNPRLQKYRENLQAYNFKVEYVKGHKNIVADKTPGMAGGAQR